MSGTRALVDLVTAALQAVRSVPDACQTVVTILRTRGRSHPEIPIPDRDQIPSGDPLTAVVLLCTGDRLRCFGAAGTWYVFDGVPLNTGMVGRVFRTGQPAILRDVTTDPDYTTLSSGVLSDVCVPLKSKDGRSIGILNLEWATPIDEKQWSMAACGVAAALEARIAALGGVPPESGSQRMLRHALALTSAPTENDLLSRSLIAAQDVSGLSTAAILLPTSRQEPPRHIAASQEYPEWELPGTRSVSAHSIVDNPVDNSVNKAVENPVRIAGALGPLAGHIARADQEILKLVLSQIHRHGSAYTLGDPAGLNAREFRSLAELELRTAVVVPMGADSEAGGVLLCADARVSRPAVATVSLLELLASQTWICLERLRTLAYLNERAGSDPLTGLRHHGRFAERLALARPGRTAVLAIDVDEFKVFNDTYGHPAGDQLLVDLVRALQAVLRPRDDLYRIGGDEFAAVVEVNHADEAVRIGERLVAAARTTGRTISVGVAVRTPGESPQSTVRRADSALYAVKRSGRDGVRFAEPDPDEELIIEPGNGFRSL